MTTPRHDSPGDVADLERALADAMDGFARRFQPPRYLPGAFRPRPRRTPSWPGLRGPRLVAAASVLVVAGVVAVSLGLSRSADSTAPGGSSRGPHPWTGPSALNPGPGIAMKEIFDAAVQYQNPATAGQVDLRLVKDFLKDEATFRRLWGRDALGVTCGQRIDGYTITWGRVDFFQGGRRLPIWAAVVFTPDEIRISDVHCAPEAVPGATGTGGGTG